MTDNNQFHAENGATNQLVESPTEDQGGWSREVATSAWTTDPFETRYGTSQRRNPGASHSGYRPTVGQPHASGSATATQRSYSTSAWSRPASAAVVRDPLPRLSYDGPIRGPRGPRPTIPRIQTNTSAVSTPRRPDRRHTTHGSYQMDRAAYPEPSAQGQPTLPAVPSSPVNTGYDAQDPNIGRALSLASRFEWLSDAQLGCLADYIHTVPLLEPPLDLDETFSTKHPEDFGQPERWIYSAGNLICASEPFDTVPLEAASVEEWRSIRAGLAHTAVALLSVVKGARDARIQATTLDQLDLSAAFQAFHSALSSAINDVPSARKKRKEVESRARWDSTKPPQDALVWTVEGPNNTVHSKGSPGGLFANAT